MSKQTLILNSHSLSNFQQCEARHLFADKICLEPLISKKVFDEGTMIHAWLRIYYYNKKKFSISRNKCLANPIMWINGAKKHWGIEPNRAFELYRILISYQSNYKNETWQTIGTEVGFSKILYEDDQYLFIYEGKMDWLGYSGTDKIVVDHKSRNGKYQIYEFNNQCRGYLWATGANKFVYNMITMTNIPSFERIAYSFSDSQIETWKNDTIEWYKRVAQANANKNFVRSWNCSSKYGVCEFHSLCENPEPERQLFTIKSTFKIGKIHRSW